MSEGQLPPTPRRPATARPRQADEHEALQPTTDELDAIERQHAALTSQADARVDPDPDLGLVWVRLVGRGAALNYAACIRWPADLFAERLAAVERRMRDAGEWPVVSVAEGVSRPSDMTARLSRAGWLSLSSERIMWTRHPPTVPHLDPGLRVEAVTPASAIECVRLETANFGLPPDQIGERAERLVRSVTEDGLRVFLLRLAREPIASARLAPGPGGGALSAIGVAVRHRRRGYGRLISAVATRAGLATGHALVWLSVDEANDAALATYRGLGFRPAYAWSRWAAPA